MPLVLIDSIKMLNVEAFINRMAKIKLIIVMMIATKLQIRSLTC